MNRTRRLLRAALSLIGLCAVVGGLPALLIGFIGWPLPHAMPSPDQVRIALGDGWRPGQRFVLGVLAVLAWLLWAQVLRHVLSQFRLQLRLQQAAATGDQLAPQLAVMAAQRRGLAARLAGWLVGGLMLASPLLPSAAMAAPARAVPVVMQVTRATVDPLAGTPAITAPAAATVRSAPSYVVHTWAERRDCLWNIADRYLGDPFRWTEIRDLNADRVQDDGRSLGQEPSSWVYRGWELVLPPDATGVDVVPAQVPAPAPGASSTPSSAAASPVAPTVPATASPVTAPAPTIAPAPTTAPTPVAPAPAATAPTTVVATTSAPTTVAATSTSSSTSPTAVPIANATPPASTPATPTTSAAPTPTKAGKRQMVAVSPWATRAAMAGALGLPIFALGGWLARLRKGRMAQVSHARPGRDVVRPADPELETLEARAWAIAGDQAEEWIDAALRALTGALVGSDVGTPELRCVRAGEMGIEVLLGQPIPLAPDGWEATDGGHVWRPALGLGLDELRAQGLGQPALSPAMVSLGATPEGPILADLEGFGALAVEGDASRVRAFLAGAALELTSASWAQGVDLRVYGLAGFERMGVATDDGGVLLNEATETAELMAEGLSAHGSALAARVDASGAGEPWYPMVVIVGPDADPRIVEDLAALAIARTGVALVAAGALATAEWQLVVGPTGTAVLKPLGLDVSMAGVDDVNSAVAAGATVDHDAAVTVGSSAVQDDVGPAGEGTAVSAGAVEVLPESTAPLAPVVVDQGGLDEGAIGTAVGAMVVVEELDDVATPTPFVAPSRQRRPELRRERDCEVWVSILRRTPEVTGWAHESRTRRKLAEVVIYLAVYGRDRPIPGDELRTQCWPPVLETAAPGQRPTLKEMTTESFHQAMSRLRRQLGQGAAGPHLPLAVDGGYVPGPGVGCDWTLFQGLVALGAEAAARHETDKAIAAYWEALQLVAGQPFADVAGGACVWADAKQLTTDIGLAVAEAAATLAELAMPTDPETAVRATQQGLLLLPTQLPLFDSWMYAATELGDAAGLQRALDAKCWAHNQLDPDAGVPPETMNLYRTLMRRLRGEDHEMVGAGR